MRSRFYIFILVVLAFSSSNAMSQTVEKIEIPGLEKILNKPDNRLYVVNFWATWCPPCVREFPNFQNVAKDYDSTRVKFIMISLDFPSQIETHLLPFLEKNNVSLDVAVMMNVDYNAWIDKVDASWQGDIPATLIFNNFKKIRHFHTGELDEQGLRRLIKTSL